MWRQYYSLTSHTAWDSVQTRRLKESLGGHSKQSWLPVSGMLDLLLFVSRKRIRVEGVTGESNARETDSMDVL